MTGKLRKLVTDAEIQSALDVSGWKMKKAASLLSDMVGEEVSPQVLNYWAKDFERPVKEGPKILVFDIETSPITAYVWGLFKQNVSLPQIVQDWYVICWAAKWLDKDDVYYASGSREDEIAVVQELWDMLDEADIVVAHNAKRFDVKKMNAKFFEHNLGQPSYYKVVDTLQIAKGNFALTSNKLDYITKLKLGEGKHKTDFDLWKGCMEGNSESMTQMLDYCIQDVRELEHIYKSLRSWDSSHPSWGSYTDVTTATCNVCGHSELVPVGDYHTAVSSFDVVECMSCGHQQRSRVNTRNKNTEKQVNVR